MYKLLFIAPLLSLIILNLLIGGFLIYNIEHFTHLPIKCNSDYEGIITELLPNYNQIIVDIYYQHKLYMPTNFFKVTDIQEYKNGQSLNIYQQCALIFYNYPKFYLNQPNKILMNNTVAAILLMVWLILQIIILPCIIIPLIIIIYKTIKLCRKKYCTINSKYDLIELDEL